MTRDGSRERYAIHDYLEADAAASVDGRDLGPVAPCPPAGFGFSEFPDGAAIVRVTSIFEASVTFSASSRSAACRDRGTG